jgi:hypothetical protein
MIPLTSLAPPTAEGGSRGATRSFRGLDDLVRPVGGTLVRTGIHFETSWQPRVDEVTNLSAAGQGPVSRPAVITRRAR